MISVLVIMNSFAPLNTCGSIPNTKLIKYLAGEDVKLTLIADQVEDSDPQDEGLWPAGLNDVPRIRVRHSSLFRKTISKTRTNLTNSGAKTKMKMARNPLKVVVVEFLKNSYFRLKRRDWLRSAKRAVRRELAGQHFDVVYSSYPAYSAHVLARYIRRHHMADAWIADFRDPMYYEMYHSPSALKRNKKWQAAVEREADRVTIVSEDAKEKFLLPGVDPSKITVIPNGYDPDDFDADLTAAAATGDTLRIFYAGTLYGGRRDLTPLLKSIKELADEGELDLSHVSVEYAGNEWLVLKDLSERLGVPQICRDYGYITRGRVMEIMGEIDASIVCTHNTAADRGVVTGKVFELLLVGKPIIALVSGEIPGSELGNIVKTCTAGIVYEEATADADYAALKAWVKQAYDAKIKTGSVPSTLNEAEREQYSYRHLSHVLYEQMGQAGTTRQEK